MVGCRPAGKSGSQKAEPKQNVELKLDLPADAAPSDLVMVGDDGELLQVGDSTGKAYRAFPKPPKAFTAVRLPDVLARIQDPVLSAEGWSTAEESFGLVLIQERVILATHTLDGVDERQWSQILDRYDRFPFLEAITVGSGKVQYRFYQQEGQRLMLAFATDYRGRRSITVALGLSDLMDTLRMSPSKAEEDFAKATEALNKANGRN